MPTAALLTLTAAGTAHAATPDPPATITSDTSDGALTRRNATVGSGSTLGAFTLGGPDSGGNTTVPTLTPPPAGTLLARTDVLPPDQVGTCATGTTGSGVRNHVDLVTSYPLNADTPVVANQTVAFDYCRNPGNGRAEVLGIPQVDSFLTDSGKKFGIEKIVDHPVQVIPQSPTPAYDGSFDSFLVTHSSVFEQPSRPRGPFLGKIRYKTYVASIPTATLSFFHLDWGSFHRRYEVRLFGA